MKVTVSGYVLALAKEANGNKNIVRSYIEYVCDYNAAKDDFDKDIKDITIDDVYAKNEYEIAYVSGKFIEGYSELVEIIQVFDWNVDIE